MLWGSKQHVADVDTSSHRETRGAFRNNKLHTTDSQLMWICVSSWDTGKSTLVIAEPMPKRPKSHNLAPSTCKFFVVFLNTVNEILVLESLNFLCRHFKEVCCKVGIYAWSSFQFWFCFSFKSADASRKILSDNSTTERITSSISQFLLVLHRNSMWFIFISCNYIPHKLSYFKFQKRNKKRVNVKHMCCELTKL